MGVFDAKVITALSKPQLVAPQIDVSLLVITGDSGGTLTVTWSDTNFYGLGPVSMNAADTVLSNNVIRTYTGYVDSSNALFGTGTQVGAFTLTGPTASRAIVGPGPAAQPYSMTAVVVAQMAAHAGYSLAGLKLVGTPPPPLGLTCPPATTGTVGVTYNSALMATGGIPPYTFSIISGSLPDGLTLDSNTGAITGKPTQPGTFSFTAKVVDSNSDTAQNSVTIGCAIIVTQPPPISLQCPTTTVGEVNAPYTAQLIAGGGVPPYTFSIISGSLPDGLHLDSGTGVISGIPSAAGPFAFTAQVKDSTNTVAGTTTSNCSITIHPPPSLSCLGIGATGEVNVPFNAPAPAVSGGIPPYTFSVVGTLPAGLTLNPDGSITGTPTAAGFFSLQVTDSKGAVGTNDCPYTIVGRPSLACSGTAAGEVGAAFDSGPMTVTGGTGPYTFFIASGALPGGINFDAGTGRVYGTATAPGSFTLGVKDSLGAIATGNCPFTFIAGPSLTCLTAGTTGTVGTPFNASGPTVVGGTPPYFFSVIGTLPGGLTLSSSTGAISGTPTAAGTFSLQVRDSNFVSAAGSCPYSITIAQVPQIGLTKTASVTTAPPGSPVTFTYVVKNTGTVPLTNVVVMDDAATPGYTPDDFMVGTVASLAAGQSVTFTATRIPPAQQCMTINNTPTLVGTLITETLPSGDIRVTYRQSRNVVDNIYGTSATAATGWPNGHKFGDFTGSDKAQFRFTDSTGKIVLEFYADYLSSAATTRYPSGYGTLGATGGDGSMVVGSSANILSVNTSMTTNLNQSSAFYGFTTNSPVEPYAGWDYVDSYTVVISKNAFGTAGFGNVGIVGVHNSPSKLGFNLVIPTPCTADATNTATVTAYYGSLQLTAGANATVKVNGGGGAITGSIGDLVWYDYNANGKQDAGETGIGDATVTLSGAATATDTTDMNGTYQFTGLFAGTYTVCVTPTTLPAGLSQTYDLDGVATPHCATVSLATGQNRTDVDFGYRPTPPLGLTKTPDVNSADIGEAVTYTYQVVNTGSTTLSNVSIVDDAGTPGQTADDFVVGSLASLPPNVPMTFTATAIPPANMCMLINNVSKPVGTLTVTELPNGDYQVVYRQNTSIVDNTYGNTASSDWPNGHKFSDFTGSDKAEFVFKDAKGTVVLDFFADYLSASTAFPSGFGTLGVSGGDGKMVTGSASNIVSITTSMTTNLNQSSAYYGYTTNSPAPPNANWDYVDSYTVVVKGSVFGTAGFGGVSVPIVHNSPSKTGVNETDPTVCSTGTTNIATATASDGGIPVEATAKATVLIGISGSTAGPFVTYKQDQYGDPAKPAGKLVAAKFGSVYPTGITIGVGFTAQFSSAAAVAAFLPQGGGPHPFTKNYTNPTTSNAGELAGQVLALQINVDFSEAGILTPGLGDLQVKTGKFTGWNVSAVLQLANQVLGGAAPLPAGVSITELKDTVKHINENYENGTNNRGYLY